MARTNLHAEKSPRTFVIREIRKRCERSHESINDVKIRTSARKPLDAKGSMGAWMGKWMAKKWGNTGKGTHGG